MEDLESLPPGFATRDNPLGDGWVGDEAVEHVVASVGSAGDAAEVIGVGAEDWFGGFPDGGAVFVKGELVEDEIAGKAAGGAWVGGEDFDAAGLAVDSDA